MATSSLSRRARSQGSDWPTLWCGSEHWPKPHIPEPIDPDADGVVLLCWRAPHGGGTATTHRIAKWPDLDTAVPCPCGPKCEGRHALVFADHGRVRVRSVHEPTPPNLSDELRHLYPPPPRPRRIRQPKSTQARQRQVAGTLATPTTPHTPQGESQRCHAARDWRQRWARKLLMTIG
jgi:hypothetical protein